MKKLLILAAMMAAMLLTGCETASELLKPEETDTPVVVTPQKPIYSQNDEVVEPTTKISRTQILQMTNEWTIMGDFKYKITDRGQDDRIVLATSAKSDGKDMMWDDSQYWTLAVIAKDGAYNLFSERMQGYVYAEVNEAFIGGFTTTVITAYIFSNTDRDIRNYVYDPEEDVFTEYQEYTTKSFSTGGINNLFTSMPEYAPW